MKSNYKKLLEAERTCIYREQGNNFAKAVIAAVLLAMHRRGRTKKYIQELFEDILLVLDQPVIEGVEMTNIDVESFISEKYGIDFERVNVRLETEAQIRKREKGERKWK